MEGKPCAHHSPRVRSRTSTTIPTLAANAPRRSCKPCQEPAPAHYPQNASNERCSGSAKNKKVFLGAWGLAAMAKLMAQLRLTTLASMPGLSPWSGPQAHVELALGVSLLLATARPSYVPPLGRWRCSTCSTDPRCRIHPSPAAGTAAEPGKESLGWAPVRGMLERVSQGLAPPLSHQHVDPLAVWRAWKSEWETGANPAAAGTMLKCPLMREKPPQAVLERKEPRGAGALQSKATWPIACQQHGAGHAGVRAAPSLARGGLDVSSQLLWRFPRLPAPAEHLPAVQHPEPSLKHGSWLDCTL